MKKYIALILLLLALPVAALADVDLSGMSFDELVALKEKIDLAIWNSQEWQEVTVPQGIWKVGEDIPEGHWTIKPVDGVMAAVSYGNTLKENGKEISYNSKDHFYEAITSINYSGYEKGESVLQIDVDAKTGSYIEIEYGDVVFSPYTGKPALGFSKGGVSVKAVSTPAPTFVPADSDGYSPFDFAKASRYPEDYLYTSVIIEGTIVQLLGSYESGYDMRISTKGDYGDIVYILAPASTLPSARVFEGDLVRIKGRMYGEHTYQSKGGDNITLPYAFAHSVEILNLQ